MTIDLRAESNPAVLKEVALLLERENDRLVARVTQLTEELVRLKGGGAEAVQLELENLRQLLERRNQALFGPSSEKTPKRDDGTRRSRAPQKGHGPTAQLSLPVEDVVVSLEEPGEACCPKCGLGLCEIPGQFETSEEVTVIERRFVLRRIRRKKYRCRCNAHIETAPAPPKLKPGARYSVDFALAVAIEKFVDHIPLERQVRAMLRQGLQVTSQTLWDQIDQLARLARPTYEAIHREVLRAEVIGADETRWPVLGKGNEGKDSWYAWCIRGPGGVAFRILDGRSKAAARTLLQGYTGVVVADGYGAYSALAGDPVAPFTLAHCWAHVRRKFWEIRENYPESCREILDLIAELYTVERLIPKELSEQEQLSLRAEFRDRLSRPLVDGIERWGREMAVKVLGQSGLGRAIAYMQGLWPGLVRFLENPKIPLDNNGTEQAIRGPVVGRKNFYGSRSRRGAEVAATFYTIFETAKALKLDPAAYLRTIVGRALQSPGSVTLPADFCATS
jgi:transposase